MSSKRLKIFVTGAGGFLGGSIAAGLAKDGHHVIGLIRRPELSAELERLGIQPVVGTLDDRELLIAQAKQADAVINAASSDHRGAVEALLGERGAAKVFHEDALPEPTKDKAARVAIDRLVLEASDKRGVRSAVICPTLIYGHGKVAGSESVQLPRLVKQAQKSGVVRHVGSGGNIWSNVHIDDVVQLYKLALEKTPPGTFYFAESGEASYHEMSEAIAVALKLGPAQPWSIEEATKEWGYEMSSYALGSNSRVRGKRAREILGWQPKRTSVIDWIKTEMVR
ncbi:NAD dependent epimerase/dehydratase family domain-containing protein [Ditylenchus destructor]|nr:NAD dependent epimerase/dehydratase family domain-containing protein [Ditylenchus destructor]